MKCVADLVKHYLWFCIQISQARVVPSSRSAYPCWLEAALDTCHTSNNQMTGISVKTPPLKEMKDLHPPNMSEMLQMRMDWNLCIRWLSICIPEPITAITFLGYRCKMRAWFFSLCSNFSIFPQNSTRGRIRSLLKERTLIFKPMELSITSCQLLSSSILAVGKRCLTCTGI